MVKHKLYLTAAALFLGAFAIPAMAYPDPVCLAQVRAIAAANAPVGSSEYINIVSDLIEYCPEIGSSKPGGGGLDYGEICQRYENCGYGGDPG